MKKTACWLGLIFLFSCGSSPLLAAAPNASEPKWYADLFAACVLYNSGIHEVQSDPELAVQVLSKAQDYAKAAFAEGGAQHVDLVAELIGKALALAKSEKGSTEPVADKPVAGSVTPAVNRVIEGPARENSQSSKNVGLGSKSLFTHVK
jgi:hypothetical protein